jgi:hypothetical protein
VLAVWLRRAGFVAPLALGIAVITAPATFGLLDHLPLPGVRPAEADNPPLMVGLDTAFGVTRVFGMPIRTYRVRGDQLWLYELRSETDHANLRRIARGEVDLDHPATGPVPLDRVSVLRFDGESKRLKALYLR